MCVVCISLSQTIHHHCHTHIDVNLHLIKIITSHQISSPSPFYHHRLRHSLSLYIQESVGKGEHHSISSNIYVYIMNSRVYIIHSYLYIIINYVYVKWEKKLSQSFANIIVSSTPCLSSPVWPSKAFSSSSQLRSITRGGWQGGEQRWPSFVDSQSLSSSSHDLSTRHTALRSWEGITKFIIVVARLVIPL